MTQEDIKALIEGTRPSVVEDPAFVCQIGEYRVVYSLEDQPQGLSAHISISKNKQLDMNSENIDVILEAFGIRWRELNIMQMPFDYRCREIHIPGMVRWFCKSDEHGAILNIVETVEVPKCTCHSCEDGHDERH